MVLVDTSVWIDFFAGRKASQVTTLISLLDREETIAFTGFILQELLQGCPDQVAANTIESHFAPFVEIFPQRSSYRLAAKLYRDCRKKGRTIRSSMDCLIAACAMEHDCLIHHKDRDFTHLEKVCNLKVLKP